MMQEPESSYSTTEQPPYGRRRSDNSSEHFNTTATTHMKSGTARSHPRGIGPDAGPTNMTLGGLADQDRRQRAKNSTDDEEELDSWDWGPKKNETGLLDSMGTNGHHGRTQKHDRRNSDFSSTSTSDDVELDQILSEEGISDDDEETGLTRNERRKRRRRRKEDTDLDARIGGNTSAGELNQDRKVADQKVLASLFVNALLICSWYLFSLSISIYNTWMFSPKHLDFHFPLFTTCVHMLVQFCLASLVLYFIPSLRPKGNTVPMSQNHGMSETSHSQKSVMTRWFYLTRCVPCGAATGLDIGFGNMSLQFITLTFYTMCKSSSLAFVLCFAFLFRLEKPSVRLVLIITTMTIGVIMMVAGEAEFQLVGFILVMSAALCSGFRWSLTQILLIRSPATSNPFSSIFFLAPVMFLSLAIIAVPVEGFFALSEGLTNLRESKGLFMGICIIFFPGLLAFLMTASEFALLQRTSVVTLSICGIFKEVVTISAAAIIFHDELTPINLSGLVITIASIAAYNWLKVTKMRNEAAAASGAEKMDGNAHVVDGAEEPMLADSDFDEDARESTQTEAPSLRSPVGKDKPVNGF